MSGFSADWLALREPADRAARDPALMQEAARLAGARPLIVDLGCGSGALMRALAPLLPPAQRWRCIDADPALLRETEIQRPPGVAVETHCLDLQAIADLPLAGATLVTASALFDLVSETWLARLVEALAARRLPLYAALTYDGSADWTPAHALDGAMREAVNRHQCGDKGFGPALGPMATACLKSLLLARGYIVQEAASDWRLGASDTALQIAVGNGYADAARELAVLTATEIEDWRGFRHRTAATGTLRIGHRDLLARFVLVA